MNCPVCGNQTIVKDGQYFCQNDNIVVGTSEIPNNPGITRFQTQQSEPDPGEMYAARRRKHLRVGIFAAVIFILIVMVGVGYFVLNFTAIGYREKVFYNYQLADKAATYLRFNTGIQITFPQESRPIGFRHSGYAYFSDKNPYVQLNNANDEVALHEFAHLWYDKITRIDKNQNLRKEFVADTIKLSGLADPKYRQTSKKAQWIVEHYCFCPGGVIDLLQIDDQHFYAYMVGFTMGNYKS